MRTKTLLLTAAALAAGVLSTVAQSSNVYSLNVVGYYNLTVAPNGYSFIANQLTNSANNINVVLTNGLRSDPNGTLNTVYYKWTGGGYSSLQFFIGPDADAYFLIGPGSPTGWYDPVGTLITDAFNQGQASFLYNPSGTALTNTIIGDVPQRPISIPLVNGYNAVALVPPVSTNIDSAFSSFPGTSDPNGTTNDVLYVWTGGGYSSAQYFSGPDADNYFLIGPGSPNGFYDPVGTYQSTNPLYIPKVGQGFFIRHFGPTVNWNYSFTVQ